MKISDVITKMIEYYQGDARRIQHFMKVYAYAGAIGEQEGLDSKQQELLEIAAVTHDIGIKVSEEKYQSSAGKYQETEGPKEALKLLKQFGLSRESVERICYLIGHHHTYSCIEGMDYQILVEADFLVNLEEQKSSRETAEYVRDKIFKTKTGIYYLEKIFCES
ncbi:HD domain-containing protein [Anaerostipes sp.]|uniref:HD domain-containing protein n=1 Tax=Anaerostipes sp. TaxID=1872530 RepID=UPI0025BB67BA|nr:HD domain-containing protein [Anaerostipes sp.]MBS7006973.1 HD domain-containing protein [Anaerostipes sp.]